MGPADVLVTNKELADRAIAGEDKAMRGLRSRTSDQWDPLLRARTGRYPRFVVDGNPRNGVLDGCPIHFGAFNCKTDDGEKSLAMILLFTREGLFADIRFIPIEAHAKDRTFVVRGGALIIRYQSADGVVVHRLVRQGSSLTEEEAPRKPGAR